MNAMLFPIPTPDAHEDLRLARAARAKAQNAKAEAEQALARAQAVLDTEAAHCDTLRTAREARERKYSEAIYQHVMNGAKKPPEPAEDDAEEVQGRRHRRVLSANLRRLQDFDAERQADLDAATAAVRAAACRVIAEELTQRAAEFFHARDVMLKMGEDILRFTGNDMHHRKADIFTPLPPEVTAAIEKWQQQHNELSDPARYSSAPPEWKDRLAELMNDV